MNRTKQSNHLHRQSSNLRSVWQLTCSVILVSLYMPSVNAAEYHRAPYTEGDLFADTWVAVDGAGRSVPGFRECGPVKKDKWVGIFYWTWHVPGQRGPYDNTKILAQDKGGT